MGILVTNERAWKASVGISSETNKDWSSSKEEEEEEEEGRKQEKWVFWQVDSKGK